MAVTVDDVASAVSDFTYLSCQSKTDYDTIPSANTTANILYAASSRRQGNLSSYFATATLQIGYDETTYGVTLSDTYKKMAYAYLVQWYYERKFKNWNATSESSGGDSITKGNSGAWQSYLDVFEQASKTSVDSTIERHTDYTNYPAAWKNTQNVMDDIKIQT